MNANLYYLSLFLILSFISCKKDLPTSGQVRVASIETTINPPTSSISPRTTKYNFSYNQQGLISSVNDRIFYYDNHQKVAYSRIHRVQSISGGSVQEYIERLNFNWDAQGRLLNIIADSIYHHFYNTAEGKVLTTAKSLQKGAEIARYNYNGNAPLPTSITYLNNYELWGLPDERSTVNFEYQGNNVLRTHTNTMLITPIPSSGVPSMASGIVIHAHYLYSNKNHHLYGAYLQLGFHPYSFNAVVSANNPTSVYNYLQHPGDEVQASPDWSKAEQFSSEYNSSGYPTFIKSTSSATLASERTIAITYQ
jgi:YD repeat-containing protein